MSKKYKTTIELRGGDAEVVVEYDAHKGHPGRTYGPPENCFPAEPAWVEVIAVEYGGCTITDSLTGAQIESLADEIAAAEDDERAAQEQDYWDMRRKDARYPDYWDAREA